MAEWILKFKTETRAVEVEISGISSAWELERVDAKTFLLKVAGDETPIVLGAEIEAQ